ncbi:type VI secretion lipoprotein, VC_A0113 family [Burkholderiales bacterium JOSHI_001]|nr:type VI secretion lipoprotein, VC_A0113 family [Burkholderiales bacterium JOSHI_001]
MNPHGRRRLLASAALVPAWSWLSPGPAWAQASAAAVATASRRVALVIGNGRYAQAPLPNPERDARLVANTLRTLQFEVDLQLNLKARDFKRVLREFGRRMDDDNTALVFYYAGHGMQIDRRNYLLPVDLNLRDEDEVRDEAVDLADTLLARIDRVRPRARIFIVDACRDNPFAGRPSSGSQRHFAGLAEMAAPGALIAFSAAPGKAAEDGPPGTNSIYSRILAQEMRSPGVEVEEMLKNVRVRVLQETQERQIPWVNTSMVVNFMFNPAGSRSPAPAPVPPLASGPAPQPPAPLPRPVPEPATTAQTAPALLPGQRSLRLLIDADRQLNTDQNQAAASLALRVYVLRDGQAFQRASFDSLYDHDEAALGAALLKREALHLRPGESRELELPLPADARQLGVFAAYREVEQARWRALMVLPPDDPLAPLRLQAKARQLLLSWTR